jgi:large subunit ribosomal protein L23
MTVIKNEILLSTLVEPHVTEKTMRMSGNNIHVFKVAMQATKTEISKACEFLYGVKPVSVKTMVYKPVAKKNMRGTKIEKRYKKALVRLPESANIDINKRIAEE